MEEQGAPLPQEIKIDERSPGERIVKRLKKMGDSILSLTAAVVYGLVDEEKLQ